MDIERDQSGQLVCKQCGQPWMVPDNVAALLEALVEHSKTHVEPEQADTAKPKIWLR